MDPQPQPPLIRRKAKMSQVKKRGVRTKGLSTLEKGKVSGGITKKSSTPGRTKKKGSNPRVKVKVKLVSQATQTMSDIDLIVGDEASPQYWMELATQRRHALEETLEENEVLNMHIEELREDNRQLEDLLKHASNLAHLITDMPEGVLTSR